MTRDQEQAVSALDAIRQELGVAVDPKRMPEPGSAAARLAEQASKVRRCPHCGAKVVPCFDPLMVDGRAYDSPYCGRCGKNFPDGAA